MSNTRRALAAIDGRTLRLQACCSLEVVVGPVETVVRHDVGCPSVNPDHPRFGQHRLKADRAVARAIELLP